jgi:hypothetical protein
VSPLPSRQDAKDYLRIETNAEDSLVDALLVRAQALIEGELGYPLAAVARAHTDYNEVDNYGVQPFIRLPGPFELVAPAPAVVDVDGIAVDATTYALDARGMQLRAKPGTNFNRRPYTVTATIGLDKHPDYAAKYLAIVSIAILDLVAHLYLNRNPALSSQSDEGGASTTLFGGNAPSLIPPRVMDSIDLLPGRMGGMLLA